MLQVIVSGRYLLCVVDNHNSRRRPEGYAGADITLLHSKASAVSNYLNLSDRDSLWTDVADGILSCMHHMVKI